MRTTLRTIPAAAVAATALVAAAPAAHAEEALLSKPRHRQGYYLAGGLAGAVAFASESGDGVGPTYGTNTSLRLGQLLTPRLGLGLAVDFGGTAASGDTTSSFALSLGGQVELVHDVALHAAVGLSFVTLSSDTDDPGDPIRGVYGAAYTLGLTWDWFFAGKKSGGWALTPGLTLRAVPGDTDAYGLFLGVEITRWTGLPRNQLELDVGEAYKK